VRKSGRFISGAVKESFDNLPSGICFFARSGVPVLCNRAMHRLVFALTGRDLQSLSELRAALAGRGVTGEPLLLPDGSAWKLSFTDVTVSSGAVYTQAAAADVTDLWRASRELTLSNEKLKEMELHLRQVTENLVAITREEEILSMKMRVHGEVGASVLNIRRYCLGNDRPGQRDELMSSLRRTVALLRNEIGKDDEADVYGELVEVAGSVGAKIEQTGELPKDRGAAVLLVCAVRECLTNAIRHAGGSRVFVTFTQDERTARAVITNDGSPPEGTIAEGGGLSTLRARVEKAGGTMEIRSRPFFELTVTVPLEGEDEI
jgi:signal transduction histidine kinase